MRAARVASGAGVEACKHCAEGYLMEEWRCVSSCSAGFYATEPSPEIADGHRICRRWAHWCVLRCGWFVYLLMAGLILVAGAARCFLMLPLVVCQYMCRLLCLFVLLVCVVSVWACVKCLCSALQVRRQLPHLCGAARELQQLFKWSQPAGGTVCC